MGLKEEILALEDRKIVEVEVPEWGRTVRVAAMSAADRDAWEIQIYETRTAGRVPQNIRASLVARCLVDETGARVFGEGDIEPLGRKSAKVMDRLYDIARGLNGLSDADAEQLAKN